MSAIAAMEAGRRRYVEEQHEKACERVRKYLDWLRNGSTLLQIPEVPSDHDFAIFAQRR